MTTVSKATLKITGSGLLLMLTKGLQITPFQVKVPAAWIANKDTDWLVDFPLAVLVEPEGDEFKVKLGDGADTSVMVIQGDLPTAELVATELRNIWMKVNGIEVTAAPLGSAVDAPEVISTATNKPAGSQMTLSKKVMLASLVVTAFVAIGVGGFFAVNKFNSKPVSAPSLDMSGLPLEQIAQMDQHPQIINGIQDQMIEAVGVGMQKAKEFQGTIPEEHIRLLKSMNLDPGVSMSSAAACLSAK